MRYQDEIKPVSVTEVFPRVQDEQVGITSNPQEFALPFHDIDIRGGTLKDTRIHFQFRNPTNEALSVNISIPELSNSVGGPAYTKSYYVGPNENFRSPVEDLSTYIVSSDQGVLSLNYTAETSSNPSVTLSNFSIDFSELNFSFLEGVFDEVVLPTTENLIDITFFDG